MHLSVPSEATFESCKHVFYGLVFGVLSVLARIMESRPGAERPLALVEAKKI